MAKIILSNWVIGLAACVCVVACQPHSLQQELAGVDALEIIIYAPDKQHHDTLTLTDREWIRTLIDPLQEEPPSSAKPNCEKQGKFIFWKKAANHQFLSAEWSLIQGCNYLHYQDAGKPRRAKISAQSATLLKDLLHHREIVREWQ